MWMVVFSSYLGSFPLIEVTQTSWKWPFVATRWCLSQSKPSWTKRTRADTYQTWTCASQRRRAGKYLGRWTAPLGGVTMTCRASKQTRKTTTRIRGSATTTTPRFRCRARRRSTEILRRMYRRKVYRRRITNLQPRRMQKVTVSRATPRVRRSHVLDFTRSKRTKKTCSLFQSHK